MKSIVHISGYNLREIPGIVTVNKAGTYQETTDGDWHEVCWGNAETMQLGRVPMGLWAAGHFNADRIIWSTGCSFQADTKKSEALVTYELAFHNLDRLKAEFPHRFPRRLWQSERTYHKWLTDLSTLDEESKNTSDSMVFLAQLIEEDIPASERVIVYLVSSANHMPRVLRDAEIAFGIGFNNAKHKAGVTLCAIPCETNYGRGHIRDIKVDDLGKTLVPVSHSR